MDEAFIGSLDGGARQVRHHLEAKEVVLTHEAPWEGTSTALFSVVSVHGFPLE